MLLENDQHTSLQWPCNDSTDEIGSEIMHMMFVRGKGKFLITKYVASTKVNSKFPRFHDWGSWSQYNVGVQTSWTDNSMWHNEDRLDIHPSDAEQRIKNDDWVGIERRLVEQF